MLLTGEGYRVEHAATVRAGLAQVAASEFDLVITDLKLPDGTGVDAIRPIKEIRRDLPIILMTSYSSVESAIDALRNGAVDYIIKPFDNEDLPACSRARAERAAHDARERDPQAQPEKSQGGPGNHRARARASGASPS